MGNKIFILLGMQKLARAAPNHMLFTCLKCININNMDRLGVRIPKSFEVPKTDFCITSSITFLNTIFYMEI